MLCYCIEKALKNNCTIVFNTNIKMVFKNGIVENNNEFWSEIAHSSSFLLNFSGFVLTKLNVSAVSSRKKQHILRIRLNQSADDRSLLKKLCFRIVFYWKTLQKTETVIGIVQLLNTTIVSCYCMKSSEVKIV